VAKEFPAYPDGLDTVTIDQLRKWQKQHAAQSLELFGDTGRLTDKRPDNFLYLGLIKAVLPSAKFLVTERGWRDLATSVYSVRLGPGQNYATSLANIKHYVELQSGLIKHWEKELAGDLLRIRYEDLVLQPTDTLQGVLDWLGENWDDRCLAFHEMKNRVKTASVWQVREPLHRRSIGRWQNYRQQFIDVIGVEANA
jgi:hypothetical protein